MATQLGGTCSLHNPVSKTPSATDSCSAPSPETAASEQLWSQLTLASTRTQSWSATNVRSTWASTSSIERATTSSRASQVSVSRRTAAPPSASGARCDTRSPCALIAWPAPPRCLRARCRRSRLRRPFPRMVHGNRGPPRPALCRQPRPPQRLARGLHLHRVLQRKPHALIRLARSFGWARRRTCSPYLSKAARASLILTEIRFAIRINASGLRCSATRAGCRRVECASAGGAGAGGENGPSVTPASGADTLGSRPPEQPVNNMYASTRVRRQVRFTGTPWKMERGLEGATNFPFEALRCFGAGHKAYAEECRTKAQVRG
jgi:hypothetical protein